MYEVPAAWGKSELVTYQMLAEVRPSVSPSVRLLVMSDAPISSTSDGRADSYMHPSTNVTHHNTAELGDDVRGGRGARGALLLRGLPHERHRQEDGPEASGWLLGIR